MASLVRHIKKLFRIGKRHTFIGVDGTRKTKKERVFPRIPKWMRPFLILIAFPVFTQSQTIKTAGTAYVGYASTIPTSIAFLPLPNGAALDSTSVAISTNAGAIKARADLLATEATLASLADKVTAVNTGAVTISASLPAGSNEIGKVTGSTAIIQGSGGLPITATGSSLNVNCTGGCGAPSQAGTFIAYSTETVTANRVIASLVNTDAITVLKIISIRIDPATEVGITGLVAAFRLHRITGHSVGTLITGNIQKADNSDASLNSNVTFRKQSTMSGPSPSMGHVTASTEETAVQASEKYLYRFHGNGEKPITLRQNQGIAVQQGARKRFSGGARWWPVLFQPAELA